MAVESTTFEAVTLEMRRYGYEPEEFLDLFVAWLRRGDDILIFSNHDLGSLSTHMLGFAVPWPKGEDIPPHAWDGVWGLGWRYIANSIVRSEPGMFPIFDALTGGNDPTTACCGRDAADCDCDVEGGVSDEAGDRDRVD